MNEVWRARSGLRAWVRAWSNPVPAARIWPQGCGTSRRPLTLS